MNGENDFYSVSKNFSRLINGLEKVKVLSARKLYWVNLEHKEVYEAQHCKNYDIIKGAFLIWAWSPESAVRIAKLKYSDDDRKTL